MEPLNKILLVIDPQIDFIDGSLPVDGAPEKMNLLALYVTAHSGDYRRIVVTADRHPFDHCSFKSNGGIWPVHCVADSVGVAIWPPLMDALMACGSKVTVLHKGQSADREEYSIFKNEAATARFKEIMSEENIGQIDICGIAGDVCVADSIRDGAKFFGPEKFNILTRFTPSIDGGKTISDLKASISCDR